MCTLLGNNALLSHSSKLQSLSHPANLRAVGCHRHCKMKTGSCKTSHIQLICKQQDVIATADAADAAYAAADDVEDAANAEYDDD